MLPPDWIDTLQRHISRKSRITVLTGAGISAESGIPTFRGPEGYWTVGSQVYHPQEMATFAMFRQRPDDVWQWYLHRATICHAAAPNTGHLAIAAMETLLGDRFTLITQNVDGLHLKAGNPIEKTYQIHGNVFQVRCAAACSPELHSLPMDLIGRAKEASLTDAERALLTCRRCGERLRPHVLWFDEVYDERYFHFESSLQAAAETGLLLIVGTSGVTNLPNQVAWTVLRKGGTIIDINPAENPFSELARRSPGGTVIPLPSGRLLPQLLHAMQQEMTGRSQP
ncbi:MAG: RNA polymerase subunit sigma [Desulfobacteraceae bacterium]|nr:RNA polymerase subunit sigma [Desulfobacteraceae bacterium]MBC2753718.1 RNA polymerase subunit sigma [Desulfobacteraceae bacterium]